jgi:hypothetical protein
MSNTDFIYNELAKSRRGYDGDQQVVARLIAAPQ